MLLNRRIIIYRLLNYLTAYSDASTVQRAKITEPSDYILKEPFGFIRKPFEESELHTAIEITLFRHKMEKKLINHEQWLETILKNVKDAVIAIDFKGQVKFMNSAAEDFTGWIREDAIRINLAEVFGILSEEQDESSEIPLKIAAGPLNIIITSRM